MGHESRRLKTAAGWTMFILCIAGLILAFVATYVINDDLAKSRENALKAKSDSVQYWKTKYENEKK